LVSVVAPPPDSGHLNSGESRRSGPQDAGGRRVFPKEIQTGSQGCPGGAEGSGDVRQLPLAFSVFSHTVLYTGKISLHFEHKIKKTRTPEPDP